MIKLTTQQLNELDKFVKDYTNASNAATGSVVDSNANVTNKNVITMLGEFTKPIMIQYNRHIRYNQIKQDFGEELAKQYIKDIDEHNVYIHDESHADIPYCMAISLFPFLKDGSTCIGGNTEKPQHLSSFCGGLINLMNQMASSVAGAIAVPSLLICFDYFARKDYGDDYLNTHTNEIKQELQHITYYLNEPCSGRDGQSIFWNVSIFDKEYLHGLYDEFVYPDEKFSKVDIESVTKLQEFFLSWFNEERIKSLLTFPVITCAMIYDKDKNIVDNDFKKMVCSELADGNGFFVYLSDSVDSLSTCCRLRSESKNVFSYTLGNVGEMTGSIHVITINMNRLIQNCSKHVSMHPELDFSAYLQSELQSIVSRIHKYHKSTRNILEHVRDSGMYPIYDANFIKMERQFSTIGLSGLLEGAEYLGLNITPNDDYMKFCSDILKIISDQNKIGKIKYDMIINTEFIPGENAGHKLAQWDKEAGYQVNREIYNSYFYRVEDDSLSIIDKARMHSNLVTQYLDGGSAVHYNLDEYMTPDQYEKWIDTNAYLGVPYFCTNVKITCCEEESCGFINKHKKGHCTKCGSKNISHATRIIGFLKKIKNFSEARQVEADLRFYHKDQL